MCHFKYSMCIGTACDHSTGSSILVECDDMIQVKIVYPMETFCRASQTGPGIGWGKYLMMHPLKPEIVMCQMCIDKGLKVVGDLSALSKLIMMRS